MTALLSCHQWADGKLCDPDNRTVMASRARSLTELLTLPAKWNGWRLPDYRRARGSESLELLDRSLDVAERGTAEIL